MQSSVKLLNILKKPDTLIIIECLSFAMRQDRLNVLIEELALQNGAQVRFAIVSICRELFEMERNEHAVHGGEAVPRGHF